MPLNRRELTRRERRIVAVGALVAVLWLAVTLINSLIVVPWRAAEQRIEALDARHAGLAAMIARGDGLEAALTKVRQAPSERTRLLPGDDVNAASAELMQRLADRVAAVASIGPGCEVTKRMPIAPDAGDEPFRPVKASLSLHCASESLARLLHDIEYGQPSLFVDSLNISVDTSARTVRVRTKDNENGSDAAGPGRLDVTLLVRGYIAPASTSADIKVDSNDVPQT